jgi:primosomal protein N' (replication factor Y)
MVRAKLERCPVVLGSATPALETYHHAQNGRYRYLPLIQRHKDAGGLSIEIVDFNTLKPWDMPTRHISPQLHRALKETIVAGDQAFVLYNRRGFASYLQCEQCEYVCNCPNCSVTLTYHQGNNSLLCHYCSFSAVPSTFCPECSAKGILRSEDKEPPRLEMRGAGTEKIFDELRELFPAQSVERLDRDSAGDLNTYKDILDRLRRGEIQILVGTQMLAKGHDLPNVTLVGVADCDVGLHMPDFRAAERVFQLLTQSAGRAGRGSRPGRVILQTRVPKHPSLIKTLSQDYPGFADYELRSRRAMLYPPFIRLLRIVSFSIDKERGPQSLMQLKSFLDRTVLTGLPSNEAVRIMGPTAAPIQKVKGEYRTHLLLKCSSARTLNRLMRCARDQTPLIKGIRFIFDVDPVDML